MTLVTFAARLDNTKPAYSAKACAQYDGAFVVGSGRCGSTLVSQILRGHRDILSVSEFLSVQDVHAFFPDELTGQALWHRLSRPRRPLRYVLPPGTAEFCYPLGRGRYRAEALPPLLYATLPHLSPDPDALFDALEEFVTALPKGHVAAHYQAIFAFLCERHGKRLWVERSGSSILMLEAILKRFPQAKIVHLVRDGRDVALSMREHPAFRNMAAQRARLRCLGVDYFNPAGGFGASALFARLEPAYSSIANYRAATSRMPSPAELARMWQKMIVEGLERLASLSAERLFTLRYEDLVHTPRFTIAELSHFLGVRGDAEWHAGAARLPQARPPRWRTLPADDRARLTAACETGLRLLGYTG